MAEFAGMMSGQSPERPALTALALAAKNLLNHDTTENRQKLWELTQAALDDGSDGRRVSDAYERLRNNPQRRELAERVQRQAAGGDHA